QEPTPVRAGPSSRAPAALRSPRPRRTGRMRRRRWRNASERPSSRAWSPCSASSRPCTRTLRVDRIRAPKELRLNSPRIRAADWRQPTGLLVCGGMILTLGMGIRHGFGLFLQPMSVDLHWGRETFALAIAVQNLVWGATQPFAGMLADKYGSGRVVLGGVLLYVLGLALMAHPTAPWIFVLSAGGALGTRRARVSC